MDLGEGMGPGANPRYKAVLAVPMATLIICPVCDTRYETKAVFPPEGRKVRCSKCSHVWQAQPVTVPEPAPKMPAPPPPQLRPAAPRPGRARRRHRQHRRSMWRCADSPASSPTPAPRQPPAATEADLAAAGGRDQCRRHGRCAGGAPARKARRNFRAACRPVAPASAACRRRHERCLHGRVGPRRCRA